MHQPAPAGASTTSCTVVETGALMAAREGRMAGAALDVSGGEPAVPGLVG